MPRSPVLPSGDEPRVILAGFGRVGKMVGDMLEVHQVPILRWIAMLIASQKNAPVVARSISAT